MPNIIDLRNFDCTDKRVYESIAKRAREKGDIYDQYNTSDEMPSELRASPGARPMNDNLMPTGTYEFKRE